MPRPKGYVREDLVDRAVKVFHAKGYRGASTDALERELGVNRSSLFAEFGSKAALFAAALERYQQRALGALMGPLEAPGAGLEAIEALLDVFAASAGAATGLGCLMCNTATELGGAEPTLQPWVDGYFERLHAAFAHALRGARRAGQIGGRVDIATHASLLTASCLGIFVMVRSGSGADAAQGAIAGVRRHLQLLRRQPTGRTRGASLALRDDKARFGSTRRQGSFGL